MYNELEMLMMEAVNKTLDQRAKRRKENAIFYGILCGVVFFTIFLGAWTIK